MNGCPDVGRDSGGEFFLADQAVICGAATRVAGEMRTGTAGKQSHTVLEVAQRAEGIRDAGLKPADHSGTQAAKNNAPVPGAAHSLVDTVEAPERQQVGRVSTADINNVLLEKKFGRIAGIPPEKRQVRWVTRMFFEGKIKSADKVTRVAAGGADKTNAR